MDQHVGPGWMLVIAGLIVTGLGLLWIFAPSIPWLRRLPGDIRIEKDHLRIYIPLVSCLLLSLVLWIIRILSNRS